MQRQHFVEYLPAHTSGAAFSIVVSSINAVLYNMVRPGRQAGRRWWWQGSAAQGGGGGGSVCQQPEN